MIDERLTKDVDYLNNEISKTKLQLETLQLIKNNWQRSYCGICEDFETGYNGLPKGWAWCHGYKFCEVCQQRSEELWPGSLKFRKEEL